MRMICVEPHPSRGVWGYVPPKHFLKFKCSEGAYGLLSSHLVVPLNSCELVMRVRVGEPQ